MTDTALTPSTEADLADIVASANDPFAIRGGGTRGVETTGTPLSTAALSGITLYEPGALTLVAQAGTPVADIEAALAAENQMLPFEPMDHRDLMGTKGTPTIGAVVAANISGPRRVQAGACRDFLLGVRLVDGQGQVIKNGGRVMKNVTGYDLARLMCGAHGTLGILTEVAFKVLPKPDYQTTLIYDDFDDTATADLVTRAMKSPFEVSGAARLPAGVLGSEGAAILRLEGFEGSVTYRAKALVDAVDLGACKLETDPDKNTHIWRSVRDVTPFGDRDGDIWSLSIKPSDFGALAGAVPQENMLVDWACGRIWVNVPAGEDLRAKMSDVDGHATLVRSADAKHPRFHPEAPPLAALAKGLRQKFDPKGIFNPGLMG